MTKYISLKKLADELGLDRSALRRYIVKEGFEYVKRRMPDSKNQQAIAFLPKVAEAIKKRREDNGYTFIPGKANSEEGFFYVIQIIPEFAPNRVKLGFASNVSVRLQAHRTSAPTAKLVKCWPCRAAWEQTAIDSITRIGCEWMSGEVYECDGLDELIVRCEQFFEVMKSPELVDGIPET